MPELPEVETTSKMLNTLVKNKSIVDVWTDYKSAYHAGKDNIKNPIFFKKFKKEIIGKKITKVFRRAKNVLLDIEGEKTILVHMKMTGHLLHGKYVFNKKENKWVPEDKKSNLNDPFSRFVHLVFSLSDNKHIAFSDMRKFATVTLIPDKEAFKEKFEKTGPEPLEKDFDWRALRARHSPVPQWSIKNRPRPPLKIFCWARARARLSRFPNGSIKTVLMNHEVVAGIGNIYSDEILWASAIHPERKIKNISDAELKKVLPWIKTLLLKGIDFGGDSMSDYRNPLGEKGKFQLHHNAYRKSGKPCSKKGCKGTIRRKVIGQRSAHFCDTHQK